MSPNIAAAVFQGVTGLCAGLSGVAGGYLTDVLAKTWFTWSTGPWQWSHYQVLIALSVLGRASAVLWLLTLREPRPRGGQAPTGGAVNDPAEARSVSP